MSHLAMNLVEAKICCRYWHMVYNWLSFWIPMNLIKKRIADIPCGNFDFNLFKLLITTLPVCLEKFAKIKHGGTNNYYILKETAWCPSLWTLTTDYKLSEWFRKRQFYYRFLLRKRLVLNCIAVICWQNRLFLSVIS